MTRSSRALPSILSRGLALLAAGLLLGSVADLLRSAEAIAQTELEITIPTTLGDTTETFWLQIPQDYQPGTPRPLLVGWHQWGGDRHEMKHATRLDSIANARGWIAASHDGPSPTHWNNQATQSHVVDVIRWIEQEYAVDPDRIYMIGASMGGAAGMIFSNNHLDPDGPMVAAAASLSGIQDCHRRFLEQGINNSMIASFGGTPEEVPFEYHRNSAIYFADSTQSMHRNALHLPLYVTFGHGTSDQVWREHAEDLHAAMAPFADTVVIRESDRNGHGWGCIEETRVCDFLESFVLDRRPARISIQADEEGRWYWADVRMRNPIDSFARFEALARAEARRVDFTMLRNVARAELDLPAIGFPLDQGSFTCRWSVLDGEAAELGFLGVAAAPAFVLRNGVEFADWSYDWGRQLLTLTAEGTGLYAIVFDPAGAGDAESWPHPPPVSSPPSLLLRSGVNGEAVAILRAAGMLRWSAFDAAGRVLSACAPHWRAPGEIRIEIPGQARSGWIFLLAALAEERGECRARLKLVRVR
jgi:dienelactone hydrolase